MDELKVSLPRPCRQKWGDMTPDGQHRHCAACDQTIHDLAAMTIDEAEALLDRPGGACVRARIASDGSVALAGGIPRNSRAMKAVVGASLALAVAACQTAGEAPRYKLSGTTDAEQPVQVDGDNGYSKSIRSNRRNGRFTVRNLPAGTYRLTTYGGCGGEELVVEGIVIGGETGNAEVGPILGDYSDCIIVGVFRRAD